MNYRAISNDDWESSTGRRMAARLLKLKTVLGKSVPRKSNRRLLVATWNLREFGRPRNGKTRSLEALAYIAESISAFDLVALQEVRAELQDFQRLMWLLGPDYAYLLTDITLGQAGNEERTAFVYDKRRVDFGGFAGQVLLPPVKNKKTGAHQNPDQLARTPFMVGFRAGWFKFVICTAHIYYGESKAVDKRRLEEIRALTRHLQQRANDENAWAQNYVVLGDFNIFSAKDPTFSALTDAGFIVPKAILDQKTNVKGDKAFDQIAFIAPHLRERAARAIGGAVDVFSAVYTEKDESVYASEMGPNYEEKDARARTTYYKTWRTYQISDHRPLWIEVDVDFDRAFLANRMRGRSLSDAKTKANGAASAKVKAKTATKKKATGKKSAAATAA